MTAQEDQKAAEQQFREVQSLVQHLHDAVSSASSLSNELAQRCGFLAVYHKRNAMSPEELLKHDAEVAEFMYRYFDEDEALSAGFKGFREGLAEVFAERDAAKEKCKWLQDQARVAYESLLGDTDTRAWHSEACYHGGAHRGGPCTCGLDAALTTLRDADLADDPPAEEDGE